ncbi:MAG: restriction endonuclease [Candidatus Eremiobacter antarcticus]
MPVPTFDALMLPLLRVSADGKEHTTKDAEPAIAQILQLTDNDRAETIPSGAPRLRNRVYWAKLYLSQAKALTSLGSGRFRITERGHELLSSHPGGIRVADLLDYPEFVAFKNKSRDRRGVVSADTVSVDVHEAPDETPEDSIQNAYQKLKAAVVAELLETVRAADPVLLSQIMVKLLLAMGYGDDESGVVLDGVNDGGVDGLVRKDRLGLSSVYIQAKRYRDGNSVGAPAIQQFAGSMQERRADEGVFVTTSTFTKAALESAKNLRARIALIDGDRLAEIMYELGVGVATVDALTLKRVDPEFFSTP